MSVSAIRPLPTPIRSFHTNYHPHSEQSPEQASFLTIPSSSNVPQKSARPLPRVPSLPSLQSGRSLRPLPTPPPPALEISLVTQTPVRPLPVPQPLLTPVTPLFEVEVTSPVSPLSPTSISRLSVFVNIPGTSPTEIVLDGPDSPASPIMFFPGSTNYTIDEDRLAKRLSSLGFVEIPKQPSSPFSQHSRLSSDDDDDDDDDDEVESNISASSQSDTETKDIDIRVEIVSPWPFLKLSRWWVRDKKRKQPTTETDFLDILQQLRKL